MSEDSTAVRREGVSGLGSRAVADQVGLELAVQF